MWPFSKKLIPVPTTSVEMQLKSITGPQAAPSWRVGRATGRTDWNVENAIDEGYNASAVVYACVEKRAQLVASVPWKAVEVMADGTKENRPASPLQQLIDNPNPDQSFYEIMYNAQQSLDLDGQAFISELRAGVRNQPVELWYLPPHQMKISPGSTRMIDFYTYQKKRVETDDMIHLKKPNPKSPYFGMPVLMAAGKPADIDRESGIWQKVSLENRGSADINIKLPEGATPEQAEAIKAQYKEQQLGAKNARRALVSNADIQQLGQTALEMDFVASRRAVWTEIAAAFGMSLSNLGMTEDVNLANAAAMNRQLWLDTIIPQLELIRRQLDRMLSKEYGPNYRLVPDLANVEALQENRTELLDAASKLFNMGVPFDTINQKLELGFDEFEGSEIGYVPTGLIPSSFNTEGDQDDETDDDANGKGSKAYG